MPTLTITTRKTKDGPRYVVRYRLGGRAWPIVHAGSFRTMREARARRDLVAGELAAGRNPADALAGLRRRTTAEADLDDVDGAVPRLADRRRREHHEELPHGATESGETFGDRDPATITVDEVAEWVATLAEKRKPGTVGLYLHRLPAAARPRRCRAEPGA